MTQQDQLARDILSIKEDLEEILESSGRELEVIDLICQSILAASLSQRLEKTAEGPASPHWRVYMSLSKTTHMLEYISKSQEKFGKITKETVAQIIREDPAYQMTKKILKVHPRDLRRNIQYLIGEAFPVLIAFGGIAVKPKGEYQLTEAGKEAVQIWIEGKA